MTTPTATAHSDQFQAARRDVLRVLKTSAEAHNLDTSIQKMSPWLARIVANVLSAPRHSGVHCKHLQRSKSPQPAFLTVCVRRLECARCAERTLRAIHGTIEDRRCDCCRTVMPKGQVQTLMTAVGAIAVSAGHCADCAPIVRGNAT
jgi:hypothetical protein